MELARLYHDYPEDFALSQTRRDSWWGEKYRREIGTSVDKAITALDLDRPWEEIHNDPVKEALANGLFGSLLSCNGPQISAEMLLALKKRQFGKGFDFTHAKETEFTGNHEAVPVRVFGKGLNAAYNMPTFATRPDGKPTIGDISPISVSEQDGIFQLHLMTPSGHRWNKRLEVLTAPESSKKIVGSMAGKVVYAADIGQPCVSPYQVLILRPTCAENCTFCSVTRGTGFISQQYREQVSNTLDLLINDAAINGRPFMQTLSGGSERSPDGGFHTAHEWALAEIEKKAAGETRVQLELEMMLPPDKSTWNSIIEKLNRYAQKPGWKIGLAINMEGLNDKSKGLFLQGKKGTLTLDDHIEFAKLLKAKTAGRIQMSSLVMFGLKPAAMSYGEYMLQDLEFIKKLLAAGIHAEYGPLKLQLGRSVESYPPPDPVYFMVQYFAVRQMINEASLPASYGCVGSCSRCHHIEATSATLHIAKRLNISLPEILEPILAELGPEYTRAFREIFQG